MDQAAFQAEEKCQAFPSWKTHSGLSSKYLGREWGITCPRRDALCPTGCISSALKSLCAALCSMFLMESLISEIHYCFPIKLFSRSIP